MTILLDILVLILLAAVLVLLVFVVNRVRRTTGSGEYPRGDAPDRSPADPHRAGADRVATVALRADPGAPTSSATSAVATADAPPGESASRTASTQARPDTTDPNHPVANQDRTPTGAGSVPTRSGGRDEPPSAAAAALPPILDAPAGPAWGALAVPDRGSAEGLDGGRVTDQVRRELAAEVAARRREAIHAATATMADAEASVAATMAEAETSAAATRQEAAEEAERIRRAAESEAEAERRQAAQRSADAARQTELQAAQILLDARRTAEREAAEAVRNSQAEIERRERRLGEREDRLDDARGQLTAREATLAATEATVAAQASELANRAHEHTSALERAAGLTAEQAKSELLDSLAADLRRDAAILVRDAESRARTEANTRARAIVAEAVQRVASAQTAESVVTVLHLPTDEMKGRIIGREGRNIRTFESVTGVNVIIDDTPEAVLLSCFDPVRREIGRLTLETLVADGRIHPNRIEEVYETSRQEIEVRCQRAGEDAVLEVAVGEFHPELVTRIGQLRYRTSYGQNVLAHLLECAHIAGVMAAELGMAPRTLKRAAFLHDIGKALTHEMPGSHAIIGADLARRYGETDEIVHAIEAHHNEVPPQTVLAVLTQAADACSGGRPGARRESVETYVKRLEDIERIASEQPGVDRVYAMQAGREVRVMVAPERVDDMGAALLAREVAKKIESDLTYPGQIRVTVVRESRATEIAR